MTWAADFVMSAMFRVCPLREGFNQKSTAKSSPNKSTSRYQISTPIESIDGLPPFS